jgi:ATP-dependent protease ClpP protease subunit
MRNKQQQHLVIIRNFAHNSTTADNEPSWGSVDKTKLPRLAFADRGTDGEKSTWKYPHHWIENGGNEDSNGVYTTGTMYLHEGGLNAAWEAANGARSGQEASQAVKDHLQEHRRALGLDTKDEHKQFLGHQQQGKDPSAPWYTIRAAGGAGDDNEPVEIDIHDDIGQNFWGEGLSSKQFITDLKPLRTKDLNVHINSSGGNVQDGLAIYNALTRHAGKVTCYVDGFALSSASFIALAGDQLIMPANTWLMVHDPYTMAIGNYTELMKQADTLRKIGNSLVDIYLKNSNLSKAKVVDMMAQETWISAEDALKYGLCQEVTPGMRVAAKFDLSRFKNVPQSVSDFRPNLHHAQSIAARLRDRTALLGSPGNNQVKLTPHGCENGSRE